VIISSISALPIFVRRGAGSLRGHHAGPHGILRRTELPKERAALRGQAARYHLAAAAGRGRLGLTGPYVDFLCRVPGRELLPEGEAARLYLPEAPPGGPRRRKAALKHRPRQLVAAGAHGPFVLVHETGPVVREHAQKLVDGKQYVLRLETGHHGGQAVFLRQEAEVLRTRHDGDVSRAEEAMHAEALRAYERPQRRLHQTEHREH